MMKLSTRSLPHRRGFTLVELLVVIAIISILMGLLVVGVMRFLVAGPQLLTTNELGQLDTAVQNFKSTYNVAYIPSTVVLCENFKDYQPGQVDQDSIAYLTTVWPQLLQNQPNGAAPPWKAGFIDWNGDGQYSPRVVLEGHECLVFFLGGAPIHQPGPGCYGFATDPRDPIKLSQAAGRKGPFFEFAPQRLAFWPASAGGKDGFYSYFDPHSQGIPANPAGGDKPYVYFSNYGTRNGYNKYGAGVDNNTVGVSAYFASLTPPQYNNPTSDQIISAGVDRTFGSGGQWPAPKVVATAQAQLNAQMAAADDQANFNGGAVLGTGPGN